MTKERIMRWLVAEGAVDLKSLLKAPGLLKARLESMAEQERQSPSAPAADAMQRRAELVAARAVWAQLTDQDRRMLMNAFAGAGADVGQLKAVLP